MNHQIDSSMKSQGGGIVTTREPLVLTMRGACQFTPTACTTLKEPRKPKHQDVGPKTECSIFGCGPFYIGAAYTTKSPFEAIPRNRKEAQASNYWPQYFDAESEEMVVHQENGTWSLVPHHSVPKGAKILRTKWVYDDKKGLDGNIVRFKARLTAMGNFQREGVDYFETYASVMRTKTLRILLQLLNASPEHEMEHWDIKAAFINAPLEEDIWIHQPDGHQQKGAENMVCKLNKALYGLKQAARAGKSSLNPFYQWGVFRSFSKMRGYSLLTHLTEVGVS